MGGFALTLGILGAVGLVMGILTATEVLPYFGAAFTWGFWFALAGTFFLSSIALAFVFRKEAE